ncbi:MAG TPA: site-specific integrase [Rhodocyclaceae bacterium]|nr:site-specific integrase [Rhodocyclaceae bacterium]
MAKPYKDGAGWAYRLRVAGQDIYRSGFSSAAQAKRHCEQLRFELKQGPREAGFGAHRTCLGVAFSDYARQRLPFLKGAVNDAKRINRYLRAVGLPIAKLKPVELLKDGKRVYWEVTFEDEGERRIPHSLQTHRARQQVGSCESDAVRARLARMPMAEITTHHIQPLINALRAEGKKSATIHLERSELRRVFQHAVAVWKWRISGGNPAGRELDMPPVDPGRERVLSNEEWQRVSKGLLEYGNEHVAPVLCLMLETAMRSCEPLLILRWKHVNMAQRVIELPDSKNGVRKVPLGPGAVEILELVRQRAGSNRCPDAAVFPTTYEAVKKAWRVAREMAGIDDVRPHDLRHTSATRYALEFHGNLPVIMTITGHKTTRMAMRYVHVNAGQVATLMHGETLPIEHSPAGYGMSVAALLIERAGKAMKPRKNECGNSLRPVATERSQPIACSNVIRVNFGGRQS